MAVLVFETATQDQANAFNGTTDYLVFSNSSANALNTSFSPVASGDAIGVTSAGKSLIFSTIQLNMANGRIGFNDGSNVILGLNTPDGALNGGTGNDIIYGFGGDDITNAGNGANYVFGGAGADSITGGVDADHLYGQSPNGGTDTAVGVAGDTIDGGAGNDYINGNAGDDSLLGGTGSDRIFGGADNDTVNGGDGNDTVNGNLGNDVINGGGTAAGSAAVNATGTITDGNDFLRGGQGNDTISGGGGNDQLFGDLGDDVLRGGTQADIVTGGAGADTFVFSTTGEANRDVIISGSTTTTFYDTITDYVDNVDKIALFNTGTTTSVYVGATTATFGSVAAAQVYAQQLLDNDGGATPVPASAIVNEVAAVGVTVGGVTDTYLFFVGGGAAPNGTIDSYVKISGLTQPSGVLTASDFVIA